MKLFKSPASSAALRTHRGLRALQSSPIHQKNFGTLAWKPRARAATSSFAGVSAKKVTPPAASISADEYLGVRTIAQGVTQRATPSSHVYVGVGRSPSAVIAFLQNQGHAAVNLPLTRANDVLEKVQPPSDPRYASELDFTRREFLYDHFDAFLGPVIPELRGKKLLFIDYVVNGSFHSALTMLSQYLQARHPEVAYEHLGFSSSSALRSDWDWLDSAHWLDLGQAPYEFHRLLKVSHFEQIAEHGAWQPAWSNEEYTKPKVRPQYARYKADLLTHMNADATQPSAPGEGGARAPFFIKT
jgi:hypothetical protein